MNTEDFDLEKFVDLFDTAMSSDNPTVKRAFKNLMMVAALAEAENENKIGPLRNLIEKMKNYENRLSALEWQTNIKNTPIVAGGGPIPNTYSPSSLTWISTTTGPFTYTQSSGITGASGTYTYPSGPMGANGPSASSTNYMASTNYDNLYDNLQSKN